MCITKDTVDIKSTHDFHKTSPHVFANSLQLELQMNYNQGKIVSPTTWSDFKFYHCLNFVTDHPKFMTFLQADNNKPVISNGKCKKGIGSLSNHPIGTKKMKKEKKESEMVNQMEKLPTPFQVVLPMEPCPSGALPMSGLHEYLSKFLDKAGEGMMAWLMQSTMASPVWKRSKLWQMK